MYLICTASKDSYITDKIIANAYRVKDANLGHASTIDLFKLYNESKISGSTEPAEISRGLIKFDLQQLYDLTSSILDTTHSSFKCALEMSDVLGGSATPTNFTLMVFPLSKDWDEGFGKDVISFDDLDACNFVTRSYSNGSANIWYTSGANKEGLLGSNDIDIISSGNLNDGTGIQNLWVSQKFVDGNENASIDVTKIVSATLAGLLPHKGFRLSFTGSEETDNKTRFVKRLASRHVGDRSIRPKLTVSWDDSLVDNHQNFFFNLSGSLFLSNYHRGLATNIASGSALSSVSGNDCLKLELVTGSYKKVVTVSQHKIGSNFVSGVYSASFAIDSFGSSLVNSTDRLSDFIRKSGSVTFEEYWKSFDLTVGFYTGSVKFNRIDPLAFDQTSRSLDFSVTNLRKSYNKDDKIKLRVFARDFQKESKAFKKRRKLSSIILEEVYYQIRDVLSGEKIIPFTKDNNGTRLSTDTAGMYFEVFMKTLRPGRMYTIDLLVVDRDITFTERSVGESFKVRS
jgi:hypothetical protein